MSRISLHGFIVIPASELEMVLAELPNHIELTRREEGCISFQVTQSTDDERRFDVAEEFIDRDAFKKHQARVQSSYWGEVTRNAERNYQVTEHGDE